ncbi:MAG: autotransporter-associated beta strand repeat-containing protein [Bacteroidaceae bacterium]|nr:autotransporter-associated beta strand repeat-containing protein [Bacteroidaceae bacterium]
MKKAILTALCIAGMAISSHDVLAQRIQQPLGRGVVVSVNGSSATVTWRRLAQEPENATYNIYVDGNKITPSPVNNTNYATNITKVPIGSEVTVSVVTDGVESAQSTPYKVVSRDLRNMFMSIRFDGSPLTASGYTTDYVWPADLDGDGEMDYVVNRKSISTGLDNYVEGYLRTGEHLWTVKLGPNELSCAGQDDMILAYDMDCDGKADVVVQTSDGTRFWDAENKAFGLYVNGLPTGDTDGDGIIDYETQSSRNAPRYMSVVDGMTGAEKCSVEQTYNNSYNRTNRSALMGDEYNKHVGHVGVFYPDGIHPAMIMEWHTRNSNGSHNYHNSAFAFDFSTGKAGAWKELFCKNTGGPAFHQIRIADVDGDGRDEMQTGGYTMDHDGSTLNTPKIAHGDRFRTSDIDPERPGLETFAIQQNAGDMLGQILYDAATGESIKRWYLSSVGDVGRGECMDVDPNHLGWEMWSTMGGVYNAKGDLIPEHTAPYPTEGIWWDGALDREIVQTSDSHHNVYIQDFYKGRLIEIAKLSNWRYVTVYAKRAAFWGDIIGDWREELVLLHKENGVCVGIVGFTTDYTTAVNNIYCLQEDPHYRGDCTTKGYYQSPNTGFYLGYNMPRPQLPPIMVTDLVWQGTDRFSNYERSEATAYADGKSLLIDLNTDASVCVNTAMQPSVLYAMPTKDQRVTLSGTGSLTGDMDLWKSHQGTLATDISLDYTGTTYISEGTFEVNGELKGDINLRARGTLSGKAIVNAINFEGALNYEGCRLMPTELITFKQGLKLDRKVYMEMDITTTDGNQRADLIKVEGDLTVTAPEIVLTIVPAESDVQPGKFKLMEYTGEFIGKENFTVRGLTGLSYEIVHEDKAIYLVIKAQRSAAQGVVWTGNTSSIWDYQTPNFLLNGAGTEFVAGDEVEFNDEAQSVLITLADLMPIGKVTVNNSEKNISFIGDGGLSGSGSLIKEGSARLSLVTTKSDYTGPTIINGGIVLVKELADGGQPSSIGAASSSPENLQIGKATLIIDNSNTATNRAITLTDTATIQIANGATSLKGQIKGNGMLVKTGAGQLNITYGGANTWSGGTRLVAGTLAMGTWNTTFGAANSNIEVTGNSTIRVFDNNSTSAVPTISNTIDILKGKTLTIVGGKRCAIRGKLSGEGTLRISFPYVRGDVYTDMSGFRGTYEATSGQLRLASAIDLSQGTLKLGANVYAAHVEGGGKNEKMLTSKIGALTSSANNSTLASGIWNVGYLGTDETYAGIFNSAATVNKYGEGTLTLTGASQGKLNIYEGSVLAGNTSVATTSGATIVYEGGKLAGSGKIASVTVKKGGILAAGKNNLLTGTLTLTGSLNVNSGGILYVRARSNGRTDTFKADGKVTLMSPFFQIEHIGEGFVEGDELPIFTGAGIISLTGTPTFEPAIPCEGCLWDYSTLGTDGTIRVISDGTGINNSAFSIQHSGAPIYDLTGRKIETITEKGIYIINGKKVIR